MANLFVDCPGTCFNSLLIRNCLNPASLILMNEDESISHLFHKYLEVPVNRVLANTAFCPNPVSHTLKIEHW